MSPQIVLNLSPQSLQILNIYTQQAGVSPDEFVNYVLGAYHEAMSTRPPAPPQKNAYTTLTHHRLDTVPKREKQNMSLTKPRATMSRHTRI